MAVKYSKLFTTVNPITHEPVTILVEYIEAKEFQGIAIESLEGEYDSVKEFEKAIKHSLKNNIKNNDMIWNLIPLTLPNTRQLVDALNEALQTAR